jgi:hypothetical protein
LSHFNENYIINIASTTASIQALLPASTETEKKELAPIPQSSLISTKMVLQCTACFYAFLNTKWTDCRVR